MVTVPNVVKEPTHAIDDAICYLSIFDLAEHIMIVPKILNMRTFNEVSDRREVAAVN